MPTCARGSRLGYGHVAQRFAGGDSAVIVKRCSVARGERCARVCVREAALAEEVVDEHIAPVGDVVDEKAHCCAEACRPLELRGGHEPAVLEAKAMVAKLKPLDERLVRIEGAVDGDVAVGVARELPPLAGVLRTDFDELFGRVIRVPDVPVFEAECARGGSVEVRKRGGDVADPG